LQSSSARGGTFALVPTADIEAAHHSLQSATNGRMDLLSPTADMRCTKREVR
jgi:hypothetical protein